MEGFVRCEDGEADCGDDAAALLACRFIAIDRYKKKSLQSAEDSCTKEMYNLGGHVHMRSAPAELASTLRSVGAG